MRLTTSARSLFTYRISTWDHDPDDNGMMTPGRWHAEATGLPRWSLRGWLRKLYARGYDRDLSILVEREEAPPCA